MQALGSLLEGGNLLLDFRELVSLSDMPCLDGVSCILERLQVFRKAGKAAPAPLIVNAELESAILKLLQRVSSLLGFQDADKVWWLLPLLLGRLLLTSESELLSVESERVGRVLITRREKATCSSRLLIEEPATSCRFCVCLWEKRVLSGLLCGASCQVAE